MAKQLRLATVNKAVKDAGTNAELVQGEGYLYFVGDDVEHAMSTSVSVYRLNHLPLERWVDEAKRIAEESKKRWQEIS